MPSVRAFLDGDILEEVRQRLVRIIHPDHRGSDRLLRLEILVDKQDAGLAGVHVLLILRIGIEAKLSGFPVFDLCERSNSGLRIALHRSLQDLGQLFCSKFHLVLSDNDIQKSDVPMHIKNRTKKTINFHLRQRMTIFAEL